MSTLFHAPPAIAAGAGCRHGVAAAAAKLGVRRPLVVTDAFLVKTGVIEEFLAQFRAAGLQTAVFDGVQPDPTDENVASGATAYQEHAADALVAIGGGSPIDAAKVIAISLANPGPLDQFQGYHRVERPGPPVIVVPTTAGTGSEATKVAVITDTRRHVKMMMLDAALMPRLAFVDYELSMSMPPALTAHVGVDTLTHGIEAYVSRKANALTDPLALSCIQLCAQYLRRAWAQPDDREAREGMAIAALHGGMAFTNSGLCLVHGMSRPLGAVFHLAHGLSNALLLPAVTRFSVPGAMERYATVARLLGLAPRAEALADGLVQLNADLRVPGLKDCVEPVAFEQAIAKMAEDALASGSPANNPRVPVAAEIADLYREAWCG